MKRRRWLPLALCCLPGVAIAAGGGLSIAAGSAAFGATLGGPLGLSLIVLALLACPLSMGLMMWRTRQRSGVSSHSTMMGVCCMPGESPAAEAEAGEDRLVTLRQRRVALERELAELQQV